MQSILIAALAGSAAALPNSLVQRAFQACNNGNNVQCCNGGFSLATFNCVGSAGTICGASDVFCCDTTQVGLFNSATNCNQINVGSNPVAIPGTGAGAGGITNPVGGGATDPTGGVITDPTGGVITDPTGGDAGGVIPDPTGGDAGGVIPDPTGGDAGGVIPDPTGGDAGGDGGGLLPPVTGDGGLLNPGDGGLLDPVTGDDGLLDPVTGAGGLLGTANNAVAAPQVASGNGSFSFLYQLILALGLGPLFFGAGAGVGGGANGSISS